MSSLLVEGATALVGEGNNRTVTARPALRVGFDDFDDDKPGPLQAFETRHVIELGKDTTRLKAADVFQVAVVRAGKGRSNSLPDAGVLRIHGVEFLSFGGRLKDSGATSLTACRP